MQKNQSVSEALQMLQTQGYHLADSLENQAEESPQPNDWRLDSVHKAQEDGQSKLLVAVSSVARNLKLVFVEYAPSKASFSPATLLRKLFPKR